MSILAQKAAEGGFDWIALISGVLAVLTALFTLVRTMVQEQPAELDAAESLEKLPVVSMTGDSMPVLRESEWKSVGSKTYLLVGLLGAVGTVMIIWGGLDKSFFATASGIVYLLWSSIMFLRTDNLFRSKYEPTPWQSERVLCIGAKNEREVLSACIRILKRMHAVILKFDEKNNVLVGATRIKRGRIRRLTNPSIIFVPQGQAGWAEEIEIQISGVGKRRYQVRLVSRSITPMDALANQRNVQNLVGNLIA